jgi:hypothetical protein
LTCAIIPPESKQEYLRNLEAADEGNFNPLIQLVCRRIAATFDRYIAAQRKVDEAGEWARELVGAGAARASDQRRLAYERWRRKMEELRYAFEQSAATITHISPEIQIQFQAFNTIDQTTWETIRSGTEASPPWFFQLVFLRGGQAWSYRFFFGKHFWTAQVSEQDRSEPRVCLLGSEQIGSGESPRLDQLPDNLITLREVFVVNKGFVRRRYSTDLSAETLDHDVDAATIAQDFIREVIINRIG